MERCTVRQRVRVSSVCALAPGFPQSVLIRHTLSIVRVETGILNSTFNLRPIRSSGERIELMPFHEIQLDSKRIGMRDPLIERDLIYEFVDRLWGPYDVVVVHLSDERVYCFLKNAARVDGIFLKDPDALERAAEAFFASGSMARIVREVLDRNPEFPKHLRASKTAAEFFTHADEGYYQAMAYGLWNGFEAFVRKTHPSEMWGGPIEHFSAHQHDIFFGGLRRRVDAAEAANFHPGDVLLSYVEVGTCASSIACCIAPEPVFQWLIGGGVGNGRLSIPPMRPKGVGEWKGYPHLQPLKDVNARNWTLLLRALIGSAFDGFTVVDRLDLEEDKRDLAGEEREARIRALRNSCFNATEFKIDDVYAGIGLRLLFSGSVRGVPIYVVDGVQDTAIYLFRDRVTAEHWASAQIGFRAARQRAEFFTPHNEGWEERIRAYLRER